MMATLSNDINALRSYRKAVMNVFISHYDRLRLVLESSMESFVSQAYAAHLISSYMMTRDFASIFDQFKVGVELCGSILEVQKRWKILTDILEDLGGPVGSVGRDLNEKLSSLTGM